ncbi:MAG: hypothetical protein NTZ05_04590, partial [Chloroflexi bacterium]|nr:hypothetical protein [Chloroflexota bacterium]
ASVPLMPALGVGGEPAALAATHLGASGASPETSERPAKVPPLLWRLLRFALSLLLALAAFLVGVWPLVLFNAKTGGTLEVILANSGRTQSGVNNADWFANMGVRLETLQVLLTGEHFWWLGGLFGFDPYPALAGLLVALLPLLLWLQRRRFGTAAVPAGALLLLCLLVLGQSAFTVAGLWPTHLFPFMPLLALLLGLSLMLLARLPRLGRAPVAVAGLLAAALLGGSLWTTLRYHSALEETGGRRAQSDAIYRLTDALEHLNSAGPVLAMDWGISAPVQLLTSGRVTPQEVFFFSPEPPPLFTDWMYGAMTGPGPRHFIFHPPDSSVYQRFEPFSALAAKWEKRVELVDTIRERDGTPIYLIYTVR